MNESQQPRKLKKPTVYDELYPGRFIKSGELLGRKITLTVQDVDIEELQGDDGKKIKCIVSFRETEKKLVACKTNGFCIKSMFGAKLPDWIGKRITIFPDTWNGEPCIRIWGSPDISADMEVEISLPRRRPFKKVLHAMPPKGAQPSAPSAPVPESEGAEPTDL